MRKLAFKTIAFFSLFAILVAASCMPSPQAGKAPAEARKVLVLLDWTPNTNHTGLYVAKELGYYAELGLDVEIAQPPETGAAELVAAGKADFGVSYQEQVTFARTAESPLPLVAIATIIRHNSSGFAAPASKGIKGPKDWEGRKYGGWGSPVETAMLSGIMARAGADPAKLESVTVNSADFFVATEKEVDFTWIFYGWDGVAAKLRGVAIDYLSCVELDPRLDYYTPVLVANEKAIAEDPEFVKKFLAATERGYRYAIEHPKEAAAILVKNAEGLDPALVEASQAWLAGKYIADGKRWGEMEKSVWDTYSAWLLENKLIPKPLDSDKAFTNALLP